MIHMTKRRWTLLRNGETSVLMMYGVSFCGSRIEYNQMHQDDHCNCPDCLVNWDRFLTNEGNLDVYIRYDLNPVQSSYLDQIDTYQYSLYCGDGRAVIKHVNPPRSGKAEAMRITQALLTAELLKIRLHRK